jgi:hypothetical protein
MLASIASAKSLRRNLEKGAVVRAKVLAEREAKLKEKLQSGLAGSKLGRHRVGAGEIDVQLGEDLSESLRGLKVKYFQTTFFSSADTAWYSRKATSSVIGSLASSSVGSLSRGRSFCTYRPSSPRARGFFHGVLQRAQAAGKG